MQSPAIDSSSPPSYEEATGRSFSVDLPTIPTGRTANGMTVTVPNPNETCIHATCCRTNVRLCATIVGISGIVGFGLMGANHGLISYMSDTVNQIQTFDDRKLVASTVHTAHAYPPLISLGMATFGAGLAFLGKSLYKNYKAWTR